MNWWGKTLCCCCRWRAGSRSEMSSLASLHRLQSDTVFSNVNSLFLLHFDAIDFNFVILYHQAAWAANLHPLHAFEGDMLGVAMKCHTSDVSVLFFII